MHCTLTENRDAIVGLCRQFGAARLDLFGSAANGEFDPEQSDIDLLVTFSPCSPAEHYERYFGLLEGLETLLGRPVDLVEADAMRNPYFINSVERTRESLYAA